MEDNEVNYISNVLKCKKKKFKKNSKINVFRNNVGQTKVQLDRRFQSNCFLLIIDNYFAAAQGSHNGQYTTKGQFESRV